MFKSILTFFTKATPRFIGKMMYPGKRMLVRFRKAGRALERSGFGKKFESFTGQPIGEFTRDCARDAVKSSATSLMASAMMGGANKIFSGGGSKQYSFPSKATGTTVTGKKAPGFATSSAAQQGSIKAFNTTSKALGREADKQNKLRRQQKKVIDKYRRNVQQKHFSVSELTALSTRLEKELRQSKGQLITGLKSGKTTPDGLKNVQPSKKIKQPSRIPQEQQQLAAYTKEALEDVNQQMQDNIKAVNENISRSIAAMNKKEEEIAQKMMANLGNYNTVTYKKLADTVTKTEEVAFKKQQESAYYQTDLIADKLDSSHDYNTKQLETVRGEILSNTQTMYELDKQNRMIDENYRALEERKNNGVTLASLAGLLTQTYQMVHSSLKTPDIINENVKNAMNSVAYTAGEEVGKLIQVLAESLRALRAAFSKMWKATRKWAWPIPQIFGGIVNFLDWTHDRVFRGMLGVDDSIVDDVFGTPGSIATWDEDEEKEKYGDTIGNNKESGKRVGTTSYAGTVLSTRGADDYNLAAANMKDLFETNWEVKGDKVNVMTNSGYSVTLKHDKRDDETLEEYKKRKLSEAVDRETEENFNFQGDNIPSRDTEAEARNRLNRMTKLINSATVKRSGQQGSGYLLDYTYDVINNHSDALKVSYPHSEPPAQKKDTGTDNTKNCVETLTDYKFDTVWQDLEGGYKKELTLKGGLKMRILKAFNQASQKGIKYEVTSMFRTPSIGYKYLSPHHLGIAVDVSIVGLPDAIRQCWTKAGNYNPSKFGTYYSVIVTSEDLEKILDGSEFSGSEDQYDIFRQWGEWQKICTENELSVGVYSFQAASNCRGITNGTKRLDMVHIQVATIAKKVSDKDQKNKDKMGQSLSEIQGDKLEKDIKKGQALDAKLNLQEFEQSILGNIEGVKQKQASGIGAGDFDYYYTDSKGNVLSEYMVGDLGVKDYKRDAEGNVVKREKDEVEQQIQTDTGMALLDKIRAGNLTPEEKRQMKELVEEWEKLDPKSQKKSKRVKEMSDIQLIYNISNNVITTNPNQLGNGPEENNTQY